MSGLGSIEVLDATRPATVRIARPVVVRAFAGSGTSWPVVAVLALAVVTLTLVWAPGRWWLAVIVALPTGWVAYVVLIWVSVTSRVGVRPGDTWYVLRAPEGCAVVLVKPRAAGVLLEDLAARPRGRGLGQRLAVRVISDVHRSGRQVVGTATSRNTRRYQRWGLIRLGRVWYAPVYWRMTSRPPGPTGPDEAPPVSTRPPTDHGLSRPSRMPPGSSAGPRPGLRGPGAPGPRLGPG